MTHDSGLSSAGLICCYAMSPRHVDAGSLVILPTVCLATGIVNLYTVMNLQLALVGLRYLRVPLACGVQGLLDGVTLSGRVSMPWYALVRIEGSSLTELGCPVVPWFCGVQGLRDGVTLGVDVVSLLTHSIESLAFLIPLLLVPSQCGHPCGSSLCASVRARSYRRL